MADRPFSVARPLLQAIGALAASANTGLLFTGATTAALFDLTAAGRAICGAADAAAQRVVLALGTMATQAASAVAITGGSARLGGLAVNGTDVPVGGQSLEIFGGSSPLLQAYDRDAGGGTGAYLPLNIDGLAHTFKVSGVATATAGELGFQCAVGSIRPPIYAKAALPNVANHINGIIVVSDDVGGRTLALSDGTNWRRVADNAVIS